MKVTGFENMLSIVDFEYYSQANEHERCKFAGYIKEKDVDGILALVDADCVFENENFTFKGHVTEVSVSKDVRGIYLEVGTIGSTYKYDIENHSRVFQSEEKTISDILSCLEGMSDVKYDGKREQAIKDIIVQNNETDWQFLRRLIKYVGELIFTDDRICIGNEGATKQAVKSEDFIEYQYCCAAGGDWISCRMKSVLNTGDVILFNNKEFCVFEKRYVLEHGKYYYRYRFYEKKQKEEHIDKTEICLSATVTDNNDPEKKGRVKVSFETESMEDCMKENAIWIERQSMFSTKGYGTIFIPAIDDTVRVNISNGKAIVLGSIRQEAYDMAYQDCNARYIVFGDKTYVEFKENIVSFYNKDSVMKICEDCIKVALGEKASVVISKDDMHIQMEDTTLEITSDVNLTTNKYIAEAKSEVSITSGTVNIKGESGVNIS